MYTLGYSFRPWQDAKAIADGAVDPRPTSARRRASTASTGRSASVTASCAPQWSTPRRALDRRGRARRHRRDRAVHVRLPVHVQRLLPLRRGLHAASSPGREHFRGRIVHPRKWTDDVDYAGKRVVVIGSGATAVTLVPALAQTRGARDDAPAIAELHRVAARRRTRSRLRCARLLPRSSAYAIVRWKNVLLTMASFQLSRRRPRADEGADSQRRRAPAAAPASTSTRTSRRATTRGISGCASSRTATCSTRSAPAARRS